MLPQPPLLVPELTGASGLPGKSVREACLRAVRRLTEDAREWLAVGPAEEGQVGAVAPSAGGSFRAYGADVPVALHDPAPAYASGPERAPGGATDTRTQPLPLSALVAGWLRERARVRSVRLELVEPDVSPRECGRFARRVADTAHETGLLVLGDGSNRHGAAAPGGPDERAGPFDRDVAAALGDVDTDSLLRLDGDRADELGVSGRASWQVLAALVGEDAGRWHGELLYSAAPFGVCYHVAVWERS